MGKRVFISYSHQDSVCAKGIARFLTRQGYDVWIDVDKLVVGHDDRIDFQEFGAEDGSTA